MLASTTFGRIAVIDFFAPVAKNKKIAALEQQRLILFFFRFFYIN